MSFLDHVSSLCLLVNKIRTHVLGRLSSLWEPGRAIGTTATHLALCMTDGEWPHWTSVGLIVVDNNNDTLTLNYVRLASFINTGIWRVGAGGNSDHDQSADWSLSSPANEIASCHDVRAAGATEVTIMLAMKDAFIVINGYGYGYVRLSQTPYSHWVRVMTTAATCCSTL